MIDWTNKTSLTLAECQKLMDAYGGDLDLFEARITELPEDLMLGGHMYFKKMYSE